MLALIFCSALAADSTPSQVEAPAVDASPAALLDTKERPVPFEAEASTRRVAVKAPAAQLTVSAVDALPTAPRPDIQLTLGALTQGLDASTKVASWTE